MNDQFIRLKREDLENLDSVKDLLTEVILADNTVIYMVKDNKLNDVVEFIDEFIDSFDYFHEFYRRLIR